MKGNEQSRELGAGGVGEGMRAESSMRSLMGERKARGQKFKTSVSRML